MLGKNNKKKEKNEQDIDITEDIQTEENAEAVEDAPEVEIVSAEELLEKQVAELTDRLQRSIAEFDNFRKRTIKEKSEMFDMGAVGVIDKILPVVDNFERALNASTDKDDSMYKGIVMIYKQLSESLKSMGLEEIECVGCKFDPAIHNAVAHDESDEYDENTVVEELLKGYKYKEKIIRPSMVKVAN